MHDWPSLGVRLAILVFTIGVYPELGSGLSDLSINSCSVYGGAEASFGGKKVQ